MTNKTTDSETWKEILPPTSADVMMMIVMIKNTGGESENSDDHDENDGGDYDGDGHDEDNEGDNNDGGDR